LESPTTLRNSTSQPDRAHGESSSVVACKAQTSSAQLRSEHAILFDQVGQRLPLLTIQPADQDSEPHVESRHVDHVRESISQAENGLIRAVDRVVGQFGVIAIVYAPPDANSLMLGVRDAPYARAHALSNARACRRRYSKALQPVATMSMSGMLDATTSATVVPPPRPTGVRPA
jgi:hypothetical protein